jgi:hypothetical protein
VTRSASRMAATTRAWSTHFLRLLRLMPTMRILPASP